ncbi:MAG: very short patch repair endonuclease [Lachnospiraceae bacterium]|nr:very short patch repair endonuclease [Lachnospiraceae bacterium]
MRRKDRQFGEVSEKTRKNMRKIRSKDTSIEVLLRKRLWHNGYRYRKNYKKLPGSPDIAITKYKIAVFCDSEFFHGKDWELLKARLERGKNPQYWIRHIEENMERDRRVDKELDALEWTVIRFWGNDIKKDLEGCLRVIEEVAFDKMIDSYGAESVYDDF